jgi:Fic family protein
LERGTTPNNKPLRDVKEAEAHRSLFHETIMTKRGLSLQTVLDWHWKLLKSTEPDIAGKIRKHQVYIARSNFVPPSPVEVTPMLNEFFEWYNRSKNKINPVELAALVHLKFVTIHPFSNGNGRISRLMMNFVLNRGGYPMFNVPYSGRNSYYNALERSQTKHQDFIFVQWTSKNYVKIHRKLIK